jgi:hypothetical protein
MPRLSEKEAREFLDLLNRVDEDMQEAIADDLPHDEYVETWGAPYSQTSVEAGRRNYRGFARHAYLRE